MGRRIIFLSAVFWIFIGFGATPNQARAEPSTQSRNVKDDPSGRWTRISGLLTDPRQTHTATLMPSGKVLVAGGELNEVAHGTAELYDPATGEWTRTGPMAESRMNHTATLLPSGKILVVGGNMTVNGRDPLDSAELYDPVARNWVDTGRLHSPRRSHTATLLPNGKVLVTGGQISLEEQISTAELYDPMTGTWSQSGEMTVGRSFHTATLLASGNVVVVGGNSSTHAEVYDPDVETWTPVNPFRTPRLAHSATLLPSGKVLVVGGLPDLVTGDPVTTAELYEPATGTWSPVAAPASARAFHTAALLPSGKVLVAGGGDNQNLFLQDAELYDPVSRSWSSAGQLNKARRRHTSTLLPSGNVLVVGGKNVVNNLEDAELYAPDDRTWEAAAPLAAVRVVHTATLLTSGPQRGRILVDGWNGAPPELYDPVADVWSTSESALPVHEGHTATLLASGKVLFAGGGIGGGTFIALPEYLANVRPQSACKLYDPAADRWSPSGALRYPRMFHTATLLPSGRVLVAGGFRSLDATWSNVELYDQETGDWQEAAPLTTPRRFHTATLLRSGKVLVVGGMDTDRVLASAEVYDPQTDTWTPTAPLGFSPFLHSATLLPSGKVLVAGGNLDSRAEVYDPDTGTWSATGELANARLGHAATLLPNGRVLVSGGVPSQPGPALQSAEIYDPATGFWSPAPDMASHRVLHTATLLPSGDVLLAGGGQGSLILGFSASDSVEVYRAERPTARRPSLLLIPERISYGESLTLTGSGLGSAWEASQGDSRNSAVNFPLIQLRNIEDGQIAWLTPDPLPNFWDDPLTLTVNRLTSDPVLSPGWHLLSVYTAGIPSVARFVEMTCGLVITKHPRSQTAELGTAVTFSIETLGARSLQWQKDGVDIPGATGSTYTTPPIRRDDVGSFFSVVATNGCATQVSREAAVIVADNVKPTVEIGSPDGGEVWLLSDEDPNQPPRREIITWSMEDDIRTCKARVLLLFSTDDGASWTPARRGGGLPFSSGSGDTCSEPETTTSLEYSIPPHPPSGQPGSLYKIQVAAFDHAGNVGRAQSSEPFFIVAPNNETIKTLILVHPQRMQEQMGIEPHQAEELVVKLRELAEHPRVSGRLVDLGGISSLTQLYRAWDQDPSSFAKANRILVGQGGIHEAVRGLLEAFTGVDFLLLVGDDRIIPMARIRDRTVLFLEENYVSDDPADLNAGLTTEGTTVGRALAANRYLSDDPLALRGPVAAEDLDLEQLGEPILPDLAVGRLVETPEEILTAIATFFRQDGILDLSTLDAQSGHKVLVSGYDFLIDSGKSIRERWKNVLEPGQPHDDASRAPVDGELLSVDWGEDLVESRRFVFGEHLSGFGGESYRIVNPNGHATHHELGVPGNGQFDITGLPALEIYGGDACGNASELGSIEMPGSVVYAVGCHGGLTVPGSCSNDRERSLDLPQTLLARGVMAYVANTGYGWGLLRGVGLSERLVQILTEELTRGGTVEIGDAVRRSKLRYFLESPRFDAYDAKTTMQWTLFGFPMYQIHTGIAMRRIVIPDTLGPLNKTRKVEGGAFAVGDLNVSLPDYLSRNGESFSFSGEYVYVKHTAEGERVSEDVKGCPTNDGCYYTLNGLSTGTADLPIEPFFIFDSRLSGTSQHGVLWKGGTYKQEENWHTLFAELVSNGGNGSIHGPTPRRVYLRPRGPRRRGNLGSDTNGCPATDQEVNSVVVVTGEALKENEGSDEWLHILHQQVELEVLYFNNSFDPVANCDRRGPILDEGPHHEVRGSTIHFSVRASDEASVWRVLVVYTDGDLNAAGNGRWIPLELTDDGDGVWRGSLLATESSQITYYLQAVDRRGNVSWLEYETPPSDGPTSGVDLGIPLPVEVEIIPGTSDLAIALSDDRDPVHFGDFLPYTIQVSNLGPERANSLVVTGRLPGEVIAGDISGEWRCQTVDDGRQEIRCTRDTLEVGSTVDFSVIVLPPAHEEVLSAAVTVEAFETDLTDSNNTDSETTQLIP